MHPPAAAAATVPSFANTAPYSHMPIAGRGQPVVSLARGAQGVVTAPGPSVRGQSQAAVRGLGEQARAKDKVAVAPPRQRSHPWRPGSARHRSVLRA